MMTNIHPLGRFAAMNKLLKGSVCAGALMVMISGVAYGQFGGSISGQGSKATDGSGWGFNTDVMVPFVTDQLSQIFYGLVGAGYQDKDPVFSLGAGYRILPGYGEMLLGANVRGESWRGNGKNWFYNVVPGVELVWSGISVSANAYVPVGKTTRSVKGTDYSKPVLVDRPASPGSCDPTQTNRTCDLVIQHWGRDQESNNWGGDVQVGYRLPFLESIDIEVAVGGYIFNRKDESNLKGITGGVDFIVPLGENFTLNATGKLRRESSGGRGTDALFNVGFTYQWGGAGEATASYLRRKLMQPPRHLDSTYRQQVTPGVVVGREGAVWSDNPTNVPVSQVRFVSRNNQANANNVLNTAPQDSVVVFDGSKGQIDVNTDLNVGANNVGVIGGGTQMTLKGAVNGQTYQFKMDGTRPLINQTVAAKDIFVVNAKNNAVFRNLDVRGGFTSFNFTAANQARLFDLSSTNAGNLSYFFTNSQDAHLTHVTSTNAANIGLGLNTGSNNAVVDGLSVVGASGRGIFVVNSDMAQLKNVNILGGDAMARTTTQGIELNNAKNTLIQNADIRFVKNNGIVVTNNSTQAQLEHVTIVDALQNGILVNGSDAGMNGKFTDVVINKTGNRGIEVTNSKDLRLTDVIVNNAGTDGILFLTTSNNAHLTRVSVNTTGGLGHGIGFGGNSAGAVLDTIMIQNASRNGIFFGTGSTGSTLTNATVMNSGVNGVSVFGSDNVKLTNILVDQSATTATGFGVTVEISNNVILDNLQLQGRITGMGGLGVAKAVNITIKNVKTFNNSIGYKLVDAATSINVADSTGNTSTGDTQTCDGNADNIANNLPVTNAMGVQMCH